MTLHLFNPEHDIALASGLENFTAPHAGRQLRHDLGWLPALWAKEDDIVLVDDAKQIHKGTTRLKRLAQLTPSHTIKQPSFVTLDSVPEFPSSMVIEPWGWNAALRAQLIRKGFNPEQLPTLPQLEHIRQLSHRCTSAELLKQLRETLPDSPLTGKAIECSSFEEVEAQLSKWPRMVLKAPWSSSGRGIRFVTEALTASTAGWLRNTLFHQGSIMVEPYYNKVKDFGMEFYSDGKGCISYLGLSLFHTQNGAYTGNLLATEEYKRQSLGKYISIHILDKVQQSVCQLLSSIIGKYYIGPLGIDMMVVSSHPFSPLTLHPCVEINLRRTMGHVALSLTQLTNPQSDNEVVRIMRIVYEDNQYRLKCSTIPFSHKNARKATAKYTF